MNGKTEKNSTTSVRESFMEIKIEELPPGWRNDPPLQQLQDIGNKWIGDNRFALLKVPSAVIPIDFNYVINPTHAAFKQIIIGTAEHHTFDNRLSTILH